MSKHHKRVLLDHKVYVGKALVQLVAVLVDDIAEGDSDVTKGDDDVTSDVGILRCLQDLKK